MLFPQFRGSYFVKYNIKEKDGSHTKGYLTRDTSLFEYICFEALKKPIELEIMFDIQKSDIQESYSLDDVLTFHNFGRH